MLRTMSLHDPWAPLSPLHSVLLDSPHPTLVGERGDRKTNYEQNFSSPLWSPIICSEQFGLKLLLWPLRPPVQSQMHHYSESSVSSPPAIFTMNLGPFLAQCRGSENSS